MHAIAVTSSPSLASRHARLQIQPGAFSTGGPLRLALPRAVLERLRARALLEQRKLEALVQEIVEGAATEPVTSRRSSG